MKTLKTLLAEVAIPIDDVQDTDTSKRKILKLKNKVVINPDFSTYQARTHKDPDEKVPMDNININGKETIQSTSTGTNY